VTADSSGFSEYGQPVFRDKRRIDPETGQVREPRPAAPSSGNDSVPGKGGPEVAESGPEGEQPAEVSELETALAERTADLQRLQAEYVNYKRRVDRDREVAKETAVASVLTALLPVLDDIGRARDHNELTGGFKAVAESFERTISGLGLQKFGEVGDVFDPRIHEALMHSYSDEVSEPVARAVLQVGYRLGDRIVRPARVAVEEPEPPYEMTGGAAPLTNEAAAPSTDEAAAPSTGEAAATSTGEAAAPSTGEAVSDNPPPRTAYENDEDDDQHGSHSNQARDRD
jgi:molecular chaperone GrpE